MTGADGPTPMAVSYAPPSWRLATRSPRWPTSLAPRTRASRSCWCAGSSASSPRTTARAPRRSGARSRTTCSASRVEAKAVSHGRGLGARAHAELGEDARHVHARGLLGHVERVADLAVGASLGHKREHLPLARGEAERLAFVLGIDGAVGYSRGGRAIAVGETLVTESSAGAQTLNLAREPAGADAASRGEGAAGGIGGRLAIARGEVSLGLVEAR